MKRAISTVAFIYGMLSSLLLCAWFLIDCSGRSFFFLSYPNLLWGAAGFHAIVALLTFQRGAGFDWWKWEPLFTPTPARRTAARLLLTCAFVLFVLVVTLLIVARARLHFEFVSAHIDLMLIAMLLVQTVYFSIHWAIRPENIFSPRFLRLISNPIGRLILYRARR